MLSLAACSHADTEDEGTAGPEIIAAIKARQSNYKEIGGAFKAIGDELKSATPDVNSIASAAREILARGSHQLQYFSRGSGPESHEKTRAKPEIWQDFAEFKRAHETFVGGAQRLVEAVGASADRKALAEVRAALGQDCKACHDRFRVPE
ncbi:MAG: c-type cytochrome [Steroidobacteraceae bacterium]